MIWWRPTYPPKSYRRWVETIRFRMHKKLGQQITLARFLVNRFPEPANDRDSLKW